MKKEHLKQRRSEESYIEEFKNTGCYPEGTLFKRNNVLKDSQGNHSYWDLVCPVCLKDSYSVNKVKDSFTVSNVTLRKGGCPCRCNKRSYRWNKAEREFLLTSILNQEGGTFVSWHECFKGNETKFNWFCSEGHFNTTRIDNFINQGSRCRTCSSSSLCKDPRRGYYKTRLKEDDKLYVLAVSSEDETFIKVGRTFKSQGDNRLKDLNSRCKDYNFTQLLSCEGCHEDIWSLEHRILKVLVSDRYFPKHHFKGYTECLSLSSLEDLKKIIVTEGYYVQ